MTISESDNVTEQVCRMVKGSTMLKAGRYGKPHYRNFCLSNDLKSLQWESPNKDKGATQILIENIDSLSRGQKTKVFESNPVPGYEGISFSLMYKEANTLRSLDIVCKDRVEYDMWTVGLDALLNGFDDVDAVRDIMDDIVVTAGKVNFDLQGNTIHVKDDACDVYTWGASLKGVLGHGQEEEELVPQAVNAVLGKDIHMVACGSEHTMAMTDNGEVFSWGSGRGGKLGVGNILDHYMPLQIGTLDGVSYIACGDLHSAVITSCGELYTFGRAGPWLGYVTEGRKQCLPRKVESLSEYTISKVSCGAQFTVALTADGELFVFGENKHGQLGLGHNERQDLPVKMERFGNDRIARVSCGANHVAAVTEMFGEVWVWGANDYGQLGTGDIKDRNSPTAINFDDLDKKDKKIEDVKCGGQHSIVLSVSGKIFTFGDGQFGQLGIDLEQFQCTYRSTPSHVPIQGKLCGIDCGAAHTAAVNDSGSLFTWGRGSSGRLGHADHADRLVPTLVNSLAYRRVESVSCGANHTAACVIQAWIKDEEVLSCMACTLPFTVIRRRHHCRKCGGVFCGVCTTHKIPILESGHIDPVLVCDHCYSLLRNE